MSESAISDGEYEVVGHSTPTEKERELFQIKMSKSDQIKSKIESIKKSLN